MSGRRGRSAGGRALATRVKTARRRSASSTRWLERQLNDPYVAEAKRRGLPSRAAFKLIELDDRFRLIAKGAAVLDLGAAPGGWSMVAAERAGPAGIVVAVDLKAFPVAPPVIMLELDAEAPDAVEQIRAALGRPADVVLSDMAPSTIGHARTDRLRIVALAEAALDLARHVLAPGGAFVVKLFEGGAHGELLAELKRAFEQVRHVKPPASRADSSELYLVATGFRPAP